MKFTIFAAALSLVAPLVSAVALPAVNDLPANTQEYPNQLSIQQAKTIVGLYQQVLQNQTANGMTPTQAAVKAINPNYQEYSDSINSLISKNMTLGGVVPVSTNRDEWLAGAIKNPIRSVTTKSLYVAGKNQIIWFWTFEGVGISKYPVSGFNLLRIDQNLQVYEADIEFNSIAWGVDIFQIKQYCS